jgi:hypothetical protein
VSFDPTAWRMFARGGAQDFRGAIAVITQDGRDPVCSDPQVLGSDHWGQIGSTVYRFVGTGASKQLVGVTCDSNGGAARRRHRQALRRRHQPLVAQTVSDAAGNFSFSGPGTGPFYLRMYKTGPPDVAGVTVPTLRPA